MAKPLRLFAGRMCSRQSHWPTWLAHAPLGGSKFGVIPKGTPGKWRLIVDLSAPEGSSVNDGVDTSICSLRYVKVEDTARTVSEQGYGTWMDKIDVQQAYRNVPIHPDDRWLLKYSDAVWATINSKNIYSRGRCS